jgi:hypothetical protein
MAAVSSEITDVMQDHVTAAMLRGKVTNQHGCLHVIMQNLYYKPGILDRNINSNTGEA